MIVKFKKGSVIPNIKAFLFSLYASIFKKDLQIKFTEKSKYTLDATDQCDWNKIYGRAGLKYVDGNRKDEQMAVWRYCNNIFMVEQYYRVGGEMILFKGIEVPINKWFDVPKPSMFSIIPTGLWFGGSDSDGNSVGGKAPHYIEFELRLK